MQPIRQGTQRKLGEGSGKGRLARHRARRRPTAQAPELAVDFQPLDQVTGRRQVEHRLRNKGARQRDTILR